MIQIRPNCAVSVCCNSAGPWSPLMSPAKTIATKSSILDFGTFSNSRLPFKIIHYALQSSMIIILSELMQLRLHATQNFR